LGAMRHPLILLSLLFASHGLFAQQVLHFTRTSGWDHQTRGVSYTMFQSIATELGVTVDDDATGEAFSDPANLASYAVIVFSNTSGDAILNEQQRTNFEAWVANGGHVMGIHAASDTYRHSTANGGNTGTWDFYAELLGGSVQENPNHVAGTPEYTMELVGTHASTANLPDPWVKNEEYYYWESGYYGPDNTEVLMVEETSGPNGLVNSYDAPRSMSWYRVLPSGTKVFYTALGHAPNNFTSDILFRTHMKDALAWLLDETTGVQRPDVTSGINVYPNPTRDRLTVEVGNDLAGRTLRITDATGRTILVEQLGSAVHSFTLEPSSPGIYFLQVDAGPVLRVLVN
jgi:type 1 glutamine amidotransferase